MNAPDAGPGGRAELASLGGQARGAARWRWPLIAAGVAVMAYAVIGAAVDRDVRPAGILLFLAAVLVAHDAVLLPVVIGLGILIGRYVPAGGRTAVRVAGFVTVTLAVVAVPLVLGLGRRADDPSALPLPYGRGFAAVLALVWAVALAAAAFSVSRRRRRGRTRPQR